MVSLQNTGKMLLESSSISFERRKLPIAFAKVLFSSSECAQGDQRFLGLWSVHEWSQCKAWERFWAVIDTVLSSTADTWCEAVVFSVVYSVLWQGNLLLCACCFCQNESIKCGTPSPAHPFVNSPQGGVIRVTNVSANLVWLVHSLPNPFLTMVKHSSSSLKGQALWPVKLQR